MNPNSSSASSSAPPATSSSVNREGSHDRVHWTDEMEDYLVDSLSIHGVYAKKHQKSDKRSKSERLEATKESLLKYPQFSAIGNHSAESLEKHFKDKCKSLLSKLQLNNESLLTVNIEDMRESKFISNTESKYLLLYREWRQQLINASQNAMDKKETRESLDTKAKSLLNDANIFSVSKHPSNKRSAFTIREDKHEESTYENDATQEEEENEELASTSKKRPLSSSSSVFPNLKRRTQHNKSDDITDLTGNSDFAAFLEQDTRQEYEIRKQQESRMDKLLDANMKMLAEIDNLKKSKMRKNHRIRKLTAVINHAEILGSQVLVDPKYKCITSDDEEL